MAVPVGNEGSMKKGEIGGYFSLDRQISVPAILHSELRLACIDNNISAVKAMIQRGVWVNQPLRDEWTVLMFALHCAYPEMVSVLLEMGADVNYQCQTSLLTPLMALASTKNKNEEDVSSCMLKIAQSPLKLELVLDSATIRNDTALMMATINCHKQIVTWLASHGASNDIYNRDGLTALDIAASTGRGDICAAIIKNSRHINLLASNDEGLTVCEVAKISGRSKIAGILYEIQISKIRPHMCLEILERLEMCMETDVIASEEHRIIFRSEEGAILNQLSLSGLRKYVKLFKERKIDFEALLTLNQEKLKDMGIKEIGARLTILESVYSANSQEWTKSKCLPRLHDDPIPSFGSNKRYNFTPIEDPDKFIYRNANAIAYQKNIIRQIIIISATLEHMKNQMANFTAESPHVKTSYSKIGVMKTQLIKLRKYMKNMRETETKTRSILKSHPGRYVDGRFIHEDEILACDLGNNHTTWRRMNMWFFRVVSYFL